MPTTINPVPAMDKAESRMRFIASHYAEFLMKYPEHYVAVGDEGVVATDEDLVNLIQRVRAKGMVVSRDVTVQFVSEDMARLLL